MFPAASAARACPVQGRKDALRPRPNPLREPIFFRQIGISAELVTIRTRSSPNRCVRARA
jgi:hypothetical protein